MNRSPIDVSRAAALATPESPTPMKHQSAIRENRAAATARCGSLRNAWTQSTTRPPTHGARHTTWNATEVMASPWLGDVAECPVSGGGRVVASAKSSSAPVAPTLIVPRANIAIEAANSTTRVRAIPCGTWLA